MGARVLIVQHAQKQAQPGDPGLTPLGRRQAMATARRLDAEKPRVIWSSPQRRAVETATPIAERLALPLTIDHRLRERMDWDGTQPIEEFLRDWDRATADRSYVPRRGDASAHAAGRWLAALADIARVTGGGTAVVVSHGGVTVDALRTLLGDDELRSRAPGLAGHGVPCGAVTTLVHHADHWSIPSIADTTHLRPD